jgi:hypothetical protein
MKHVNGRETVDGAEKATVAKNKERLATASFSFKAVDVLEFPLTLIHSLNGKMSTK